MCVDCRCEKRDNSYTHKYNMNRFTCELFQIGIICRKYLSPYMKCKHYEIDKYNFGLPLFLFYCGNLSLTWRVVYLNCQLPLIRKPSDKQCYFSDAYLHSDASFKSIDTEQHGKFKKYQCTFQCERIVNCAQNHTWIKKISLCLLKKDQFTRWGEFSLRQENEWISC